MCGPSKIPVVLSLALDEQQEGKGHTYAFPRTEEKSASVGMHFLVSLNI